MGTLGRERMWGGGAGKEAPNTGAGGGALGREGRGSQGEEVLSGEDSQMPPGSDRHTGSYTSNLSLHPGEGEERGCLLPLTCA